MNEREEIISFDDLFEEDESNKKTEKPLENKRTSLIIIGVYFAIFFLGTLLASFLFSLNKNNFESFTATETIIDYLTYNSGISFAFESEFLESNNNNNVNYLKYQEDVIIYSIDLEDTIKKAFLDTTALEEDEISDFFKAEVSYLKINNLNNNNFLTTFNLTADDFDLQVENSRSLKLSVSALINFLIYLLTSLFLLVLARTFFASDFRLLKKHKVLTVISMVVVGYLFLMIGNILSNFLSTVVRNFSNTKEIISLNQFYINKILNSSSAYLMIVPTVILAPIIEELVFRKAFFSLFKNDIVALIVSSLVFGLIHVSGESGIYLLVNLIIYAIPGFALGFVYLKNNKNIYPVIFVHALTNLISVLAVLFLL